MNLVEFYATVGGDYKDAISRLLTEERIIKFLLKFPDDKNIVDFKQNLEQCNYEVAFRCVHNIKGMGLNLGLTQLVAKSSEPCEALRHGKPEFDITSMTEAFYKEYERTVDIIKQIENA